jgi:hypothetical protein
MRGWDRTEFTNLLDVGWQFTRVAGDQDVAEDDVDLQSIWGLKIAVRTLEVDLPRS